MAMMMEGDMIGIHAATTATVTGDGEAIQRVSLQYFRLCKKKGGGRIL